MLIPVDKVGQHGLVVDFAEHELPAPVWTQVQNMRMGGSAAETLYNYSVNTSAKAVSDPLMLFYLDQPDGSRYWVSGDANNIKAHNESSLVDIGSTLTGSGDINADIKEGYTGGILNQVLLLNNSVDEPYYWDGDFSAGTLAFLSNWGVVGGTNYAVTCGTLRTFGRFVIAMDITDDISGASVRKPDMVWWSSPADPTATPPVPQSWDYTDDTEDAGRQRLSSGQGSILDGKAMGDVFMLYMRDAVYSMQHIGPPFVFSFQLVTEQFGILTKNCVEVFPGGHFLVTKGDVGWHNGGRWNSVLNDRLRDWFWNQVDIDGVSTMFVAKDPRHQEMLVCFPETGETKCTRALVWNWRYNTLSTRELPGTLDYALGVVAKTSSGDTWDGETTLTWESVTGTGAQDTYSVGEDLPLFTVDGSQDLALPDVFDSSVAVPEAFCERTGLALVGQSRDGSIHVDPSTRKLVTEVWPRMSVEGTPDIEVWVGAQEVPDGAITWETQQTFDPTQDRKVNCMTNGPYIAVRFISNALAAGTKGKFKLQGYSLEVVPAGQF